MIDQISDLITARATSRPVLIATGSLLEQLSAADPQIWAAIAQVLDGHQSDQTIRIPEQPSLLYRPPGSGMMNRR
jgi:hypothetical protein